MKMKHAISSSFGKNDVLLWSKTHFVLQRNYNSFCCNCFNI